MPRGPRTLTFAKDTVGRFVLTHEIRLDWKRVARNPFWSDKSNVNAAHYYVRLYKPDGKEMELYYSKGFGLPDPPNPEEVIQTVGTDTLYYESYKGDLTRWAADIGMDLESPETSFVIDEMKKSVLELKAFLGEEAYLELVSLGERGMLGRKQLV